MIKAANLTNIDNLKILANVKAGDLTWSQNKDSVTIKRQNPVSIQLRNNSDGNLEINSFKHSSLVGTGNTAFNLKSSFGASDYNVKLMTDNGIKTINQKDTIYAKDAILYGGAGMIISQNSDPLNVDLNGSLDANSAKSISLFNVNSSYPLTIQAVMAGEYIYLGGNSSIV